MSSNKNYIKQKVIISFFVIITTVGFAQTDTLIQSYNHKVSVIITEITSKEVIYRLVNKPEMPLIHCSLNNLKSIVLKDGSHIDPQNVSVDPFDKNASIKESTILYFTPSKLVVNQLGFAIERIVQNNHFGVRIPFSFSVGVPYATTQSGWSLYESDKHRFWSTGIDFNIYPFGIKEKLTFTWGIGLQYARFGYYRTETFITNASPVITKENGNHYSGICNLGIISKLTNRFVFGTTAGLGFQYENAIYKIINNKVTGSENTSNIRLNATINLGYKF